jgi:hypothetical protein
MRTLGTRILLATLFTGCAHPIENGSNGESMPTPMPPVVPGITIRATPPRGVDTVVYQRSITRAGKDSMTGTRTVVSRAVAGPDRSRLLEIEQRFPAGGGEIVDTAVAEPSTSHQPTRTMRFEFVGDTAQGIVSAVAPAAAPATNVRQPLGGRIFDSNVIDLVVASLPLARGFSAELPFFIYERGGRVPMTVAVRDRATLPFGKLGDRDTWIVTVAVPGAPATVWVDATTRAVLRVRYDIAAQGLSFTDDRITPLHGKVDQIETTQQRQKPTRMARQSH